MGIKTRGAISLVKICQSTGEVIVFIKCLIINIRLDHSAAEKSTIQRVSRFFGSCRSQPKLTPCLPIGWLTIFKWITHQFLRRIQQKFWQSLQHHLPPTVFPDRLSPSPHFQTCNYKNSFILVLIVITSWHLRDILLEFDFSQNNSNW